MNIRLILKMAVPPEVMVAPVLLPLILSMVIAASASLPIQIRNVF
jgi:hypothetical protein